MGKMFGEEYEKLIDMIEFDKMQKILKLSFAADFERGKITLRTSCV